MARPNKEFELAWAALACGGCESGWNAIQLSAAGPIEVQAGRKSPEDAEAILLSFPTTWLPHKEKLPEGNGFLVERVTSIGTTHQQLALTRQPTGSVELFGAMACDVVGALDDATARGLSEDQMLRVFIRRVIAWQHFMSKGASLLGPEAELGLVGELSFLRTLLDSGLATEVALAGWIGPEDAIQDFHVGDGAVEVKATLSTSGFPVKIGSLEQLDDATMSPLFLAAFRFANNTEGETLPEIASDIEHRLGDDPATTVLLEEKLLRAGYLKSHMPKYTRLFTIRETRMYYVTEGFPRLTPAGVPSGIYRATYDIDLDGLENFRLELPAALRALGVLQ